MRVCFLTHYFPPEVGAPQTRIELLARALAQAGAEVTVHTGFPHYPSGRITAPYRNAPWLVEPRDGVRVVRSAVYPAANQGFAKRLVNHASFAFSALLTAPISGGLDVVVAETPPLFTAAAGAVYAAGKRAAFVVNVADRWPASAVELGMLSDPRAIAVAEALERWVYRRANLITAPTAGIIRALDELPEAAGKTRRTWPVVDLARFDPSPPAREIGTLRLLYAGTIGLAHGLDKLVEASQIAGPERVRTTIAGDGADARRIRSLIRDQDNVEMLGAVPADRVPSLYREHDAAVVLLKDLPIFDAALPTKLLEAMAAGRPVVLAARGEAAGLIDAAGAGIVVPPGNAAALVDAINQLGGDVVLRRRLGEAGRRYAVAHFGTDRSVREWTRALSDAARSRPASRSGRAAAARNRAG